MSNETTVRDAATAPIGATLRGRGITGRKVGIAVIDSGVTAPTAFEGGLVVGPDFTADAGTEGHGRDFLGHGTHLAGLAAGSATGVAPGAHVVSLKVVGSDGSTDVGAVVAAIDFAIANRRRLGLGVVLLAFGADQLNGGRDPLAAAIVRARRAGLVPVVSAGNNGDAALPTPAHVDAALTVGAAEVVDGGWQVCDFTTTGRDGVGADLVAPGRSLVSVLAAGSRAAVDAPADSFVSDDLVKGTGSSQAAAVVAGAVALLLEADPSLTPAEIDAVLASSARRLDDPAAGAGVIDLDVALVCLASGLFRDAPVRRRRTSGPARGGAWSGLEWSGFRWSGFRWSGLEWSGFRWSGFRWSGLEWSGFRWSGFRWSGLEWSGFRWSGFRWSGLEWSGFRWSGFRWSGLEWSGFRWSGFRWSGLEWSGFRWSGLEWSGLEWSGFRWSGFRWSGLEWS